MEFKNDLYVQGIFVGLLIACLFMLIFPKDTGCQIEVVKGNTTQVFIGRVI